MNKKNIFRILTGLLVVMLLAVSVLPVIASAESNYELGAEYEDVDTSDIDGYSESFSDDGSAAGIAVDSAGNDADAAVEKATVRYEDGLGGTLFGSWEVSVPVGEPTPEYPGDPYGVEAREFAGWTPKWNNIVTGDVVYVATWKEEEVEDTSASTVVGVDENGNPITSVSSTQDDTNGATNDGKQDTIGSDVDTADMNIVVPIALSGMAILVLGAVFVIRRKKFGMNK